jgi:hypothetical protein
MKKIVLFVFVMTLLQNNLFAQIGTGQYRVVMNALGVNAGSGEYDNGCTNKFEVWFKYSNVATQTKVWEVNGLNGTPTNFTQTIKFPATQSLTFFRIYGERNWKNFFGCKGNGGDYSANTFVSQPCFSQSYSDPIAHWESTFNISIRPDTLILQHENPLDPIISTEDSVSLKTTTAFPPSVYNWEFSVDNGGTWLPFPSQYQGLDSIRLTAIQLFAGSGLDIANYLAENIIIRINACTGSVLSNPLLLNIKKSPPKIISSTATPPACFDTDDGKLTFTFDRMLASNESLILNLNDNTHPGLIYQRQITNDSLDSNHAYTFPDNLQPAQYYLVYQGSLALGSGGSTVTSLSNVKQSDMSNITAPTPVSFTDTSINVWCYEGNDGIITVNAVGGVGNYQYMIKQNGNTDSAWYPFSSGNQQDITGLTAGAWQFQIRDGNQCPAKTGAGGTVITKSITLLQPAAPLTNNTVSLINPTGYGLSDGSIEVEVSGGTPQSNGSYPFQWTDINGNTVTSGITTNVTATGYRIVLSGLPDGYYILNSNDNNYGSATAQQGCTDLDTFHVIQPPPLIITMAIQDSVLCNGDANGSLIAHAIGGIPFNTGNPYIYTWKKKDASNNYVVLGSQTDSIVAGLTTGWYAVNIQDANGIVLAQDSTIFLPEPTLLQVSVDSINVLCYGDSSGSVTAHVTGGTLPYNYSWSTLDSVSTVGHLPAGLYNITIKDRHLCSVQQNVTVTQPASALSLSVRVSDPTYFNATDGSIKAITAGGTSPYTYQWQGVSSTADSVGNIQWGNYSVTATDANGCSAVKGVALINPPMASLSVKDSVLCAADSNGSIVAHIAGGVTFTNGLPYQYIWKKRNSAGIYDVMASQTDSIAVNLTAGYYALNIKDSFGNTLRQDSIFYLSEPAALQLALSKTDVSCYAAANGTAAVLATGGSPAYTYSWTTGSVDTAVNELDTGSYRVTVTDRHACVAQAVVVIYQPDSLAVVLQPVNPTYYEGCNGIITGTVTGGTLPYQYAWTGSSSVNDTAANLCGDAAYTLTVTDANGCTALMKDTLIDPRPLVVNILIEDSVQCNGNANGSLAAHTTGGIPFGTGNPYIYTWKKKDADNNYITLPSQTDSIAAGLTTGWYAVNIKDANGIVLTHDSTFFLPEPDVLQITLTPTDVTCNSFASGSVAADVTGGNTPYSYYWNTGAGSSSVDSLEVGVYYLFIKDRKLCETTAHTQVGQPGSMKLEIAEQPIICADSCNGQLEVNMTGGIAPYSYEWVGFSNTGATLSGVCAGAYQVIVTDSNGCQIQQRDTLQNPPILPLNLGNDRYICFGQAIDYDITVPDDPAIIYQWNSDNGFIGGEAQATLTQAGSYYASVTDADGCYSRDTVILTAVNTTISNEFALPTQAFSHEEIVVVNTTNPPADSVRWVLPAQATQVQMNEQYAAFTLNDTGIYYIRLITYRGVCYAEQTKKLIVTDPEDLNSTGLTATPFIQTFTVSPNPNTGTFNVRIVLQSNADIQLRLINIVTNQITGLIRQSGASSYNLSINKSVIAGTYILLLETPNGSASMKLIIL